MDSAPPNAANEPKSALPEAESLQPRADEGSTAPADQTSAPQPASPPADNKKPRHRTYRPSHKATFIGLAVVIVILAVNAAVLDFVLKGQAQKDNLAAKGQVTISSSVLSKLGVNRTSLGDSDVQLIVAPDAQFKGTVSVAGATSLSGPLNLDGKLAGTDASLSTLQAGNTSLSQLDVNGNSTFTTVNLRKDLIVAGQTQLQGPLVTSQLVTVNNSINVSGNVAIGGTLSVSNFSARSLTSTSTLTVEGHVVTGGPTPGIGPGSALGSGGTTSISGNDSAGTIAINIGTGAGAGTLASVAFRAQYGNIPKVVITPLGIGANFYISSISAAGFNVAVTSGLPPGGYQIDYIVEQ